MAWIIDKYLDPVEPEETVRSYVYEDIDLGGASWNYKVWWNERAERWSIDIWSSDGTKAIYGKRLVPNWPIFGYNTGRNPENGIIVLYDTGDPAATDQCGYEELGHRWKLCWFVDDGTDAAETVPWSISTP